MNYLRFSETRYLLALVLSLIILASCKKDSVVVETDPPSEHPEPLRVMQSIRTFMQNNELVTDTTSFEYDDTGRVIKKTYGFGTVEVYTYSGDKLTSIKSIWAGNETEILRGTIYSLNSDSITIDLYPGSASMDTLQLTYIFNNNLQTDFWTYLHYTSSCSCVERHLQKEKYYYNSDGNIVKTTMQTLSDAQEGDRFTVTAWDDKINPKRGKHKLNALFLGLTTPLESYSLHNPLKYSDGYKNYEVEMTYNSEGYPLTFKFKDQDYISTQLVYNR